MLSTKESLRAAFKRKRLEILAEEKLALDQQILGFLKELVDELSECDYLHVFLPISKWNEFNSFPFVDWIRANHRSKKIVVSTSDTSDGTLQHHVWNDEAIAENHWGIPELVLLANTESVNPKNVDLVFIPLLVCDRKGNRIGYGKGFYDRFLKECRSDVQKIGISHFPPLADVIPADDWDIPLDALVTPNGIFRFGN